MKHFRFLIIAAVAAMLGACQAEPVDNGPAEKKEKEVRILCSIGESRVGTEINMRKSFFQEGDRIALDVMRRPLHQQKPVRPTYERRNDTDFYLHNALMEYQGGEWVFVNPANKIILEEGYRYDYYAFYPGVVDTSKDPEAMEYTVNSVSGTIPHNDLLWASFATEDPNDYDKINVKLNFEHVLSMIEVRQVGLGTRANVKLVSDQDITLNGVLNVGTGEFTTVPKEGITTKIPNTDESKPEEYQIIGRITSKEATFKPMDNGRYVLYMPPQSLRVNFRTYIMTIPDPAKPAEAWRYSEGLENDPTNTYFVMEGGASTVRSNDVKLITPDKETGKFQYEKYMSTPNSILLNFSTAQQSVPVAKAYAMWLYDKNINGIPSLDYNANKARWDELFEDLYGTLDVRLLWSDKPDFAKKVSVAIDDPGSGAKAKILARIIEDAPYEGNAVYGLYMGDKLCWSWHIWASSVQNPAATQGINGDIRFMRSNIGAWAQTTGGGFRGLQFQWGRKDPFTGANATGWDFADYQPVYDTVGQINASLPYGVAIGNFNSLAQSVVNPTTFSTAWNPTGINNLWNVSTAEKSPYDPCPLGWRVPRTTTESAFYIAGGGDDLAEYSENGWDNHLIRIKKSSEYSLGNYPQTNYRSATTGALSTDEISSELWHGGASGNTFYIADKDAPNINTVLQDNTLAKGKAVRCMRDTKDIQTW